MAAPSLTPAEAEVSVSPVFAEEEL